MLPMIVSAVATATLLVATPATTAVIDETEVGDFSDLWSSPSVLPLQPGSTHVRGATGPGPGGAIDVDYFTAVVPDGEFLINIFLNDYWQQALTVNQVPGRLGDRGAFLALTHGDESATEADFQSKMSGALLIGVMPEVDPGSDILAALAEVNDFVVPSFALPLSEGAYTFWYQQNRVGAQGATTYDFEFVVTPLPGALTLMGPADRKSVV